MAKQRRDRVTNWMPNEELFPRGPGPNLCSNAEALFPMKFWEKKNENADWEQSVLRNPDGSEVLRNIVQTVVLPVKTFYYYDYRFPLARRTAEASPYWPETWISKSSPSNFDGVKVKAPFVISYSNTYPGWFLRMSRQIDWGTGFALAQILNLAAHRAVHVFDFDQTITDFHTHGMPNVKNKFEFSWTVWRHGLNHTKLLLKSRVNTVNFLV